VYMVLDGTVMHTDLGHAYHALRDWKSMVIDAARGTDFDMVVLSQTDPEHNPVRTFVLRAIKRPRRASRRT
jgi:hypothetical protein